MPALALASRCTRCARASEFINAGIAGIHIEDQLFPKRAHYHKYVAHVVPRKEFVDKIRLACRQRDQSDKDFVIIARSNSCRFEGLDEAIARANGGRGHGADMGMIFPRDPGPNCSKRRSWRRSHWSMSVSRGNRDNRPVAERSPARGYGLQDRPRRASLPARQLSLCQARPRRAQGKR